MPVFPSQIPDLYKRLGVERNAEIQEIKEKYRDLALKYHPDRNPTNPQHAKTQFVAVSEAYDVLSNPEKRRHYDSDSTFNSRPKGVDIDSLFTYFDEFMFSHILDGLGDGKIFFDIETIIGMGTVRDGNKNITELRIINKKTKISEELSSKDKK